MAPISQKPLRGLNTTASLLAQPRGSVPAISNMLLDRREAVRTLPGGSERQFKYGGATAVQEFLAITPFTTVGPVSRFFALQRSDLHCVAAPAVPVLASVNAPGGTLVVGNTYRYQITSVDDSALVTGYGESLPSAAVDVVIAPGDNAVRITFPSEVEGVRFRLYGRVAGAIGVINAGSAYAGGLTYDDNGTVAPGAAPPVANTTHSLIFEALDHTGTETYTDAAAIHTFVAPVRSSNFPGRTYDINGNTLGSTNYTLTGVTPYWVSRCGPLSRIVPFAGNLILVLGNNHPMFIYNGTTCVRLTNTFTAVYPNWVANMDVKVGDYCLPAMNNAGGYVFVCVQGGLTGGAAPAAFDQNKDGQTSDNVCIWKNTGLTNVTTVPRAAAHAISYGGALWVANTAPTISANGLDGPSVLRMSDVGNPLSWNPLNLAYIGKDDGDEICGLGAFSVGDSGVIPVGGLAVFKRYSTYLLTGVFPNVDIKQMPTDMGCVAPETIRFIPGVGIMRLTHKGFALFNGITDRIVSDDIENLLATFNNQANIDSALPRMTTPYLTAWRSRAALTTNPPMYVCAYQTGATAPDAFLCFDLGSRKWTRVSPQWKYGAGSIGLVGALTEGRPRTRNISAGGGLGAVDRSGMGGVLVGGYDDGAVHFCFSAALASPPVWDNDAGDTAVTWSVRTPEAFSGNGSVRSYFRRLVVRGAAGTDAAPSITASLTLDGTTLRSVPMQCTNLGSGLFEAWCDVNVAGLSMHADLSGTTYVELFEFIWDADPLTTGMPVRIS